MPSEQELKSMEIEGREVEGSLRVFKFPDVLQFLSMGKMTGVLQLSQDDRRVELSFREGKIVNVVSNDRYMRLGQMLLYSGHLTREKLNEALEIQERATGSKFLGEVLLSHEMIDPQKLNQTIRLQNEDELWELFSWDNGNFRFEQGRIRDPGTVVVELDVQPLLQEGARRMEQWQALCRSISNSHEVYCINPDFRVTSELNIDDKIWRVLSLVNGHLTVDALVRLSNLGRFESYWALDHLLRHEILMRVSDVASRAAADAEANGGGSNYEARALDLQRPIASAPVAEPDAKPDGKAKGGLRGVFGGKKKKNAAKETLSADPPPTMITPTPASRRYLTDVSLICDAVNAMLEAVGQACGGQAGGVYEAWIEQAWADSEQRFPRADVLRLRGGRITSELFDRYARMEKRLTRALGGIHDDCMEALRLFWQKLRDFAAESRGDVEAGQLSDRCAEAFRRCEAEIQTDNFSFLEWREGAPGKKERSSVAAR